MLKYILSIKCLCLFVMYLFVFLVDSNLELEVGGLCYVFEISFEVVVCYTNAFGRVIRKTCWKNCSCISSLPLDHVCLFWTWFYF